MNALPAEPKPASEGLTFSQIISIARAGCSVPADASEGGGASAPAPARVEALRRELGENVKSLVERATSSDATLAVYRADADSTLDAIKAYEAALADGPGEATSFWNVLSDPNLVKAREQARARL